MLTDAFFHNGKVPDSLELLNALILVDYQFRITNEERRNFKLPKFQHYNDLLNSSQLLAFHVKKIMVLDLFLF